MAKGGYQAPRDRTPKVSGSGKNAKRTDHTKQALRLPNVTDSEDLQYGDRQRLEQSLKTQPLPQARSPRVSAAPSPGPSTRGGGRAHEEMIYGRPTSRPNEPLTEGLPFGPGAGPEAVTQPEPESEMEIVLQGLIEITGDQSIATMLQEHRDFQSFRATSRAPVPAARPMQQQQSVDEPTVEAEIALPRQPEAQELEAEPDEVAPLEEGGEPSPSLPISEGV